MYLYFRVRGRALIPIYVRFFSASGVLITSDMDLTEQKVESRFLLVRYCPLLKPSRTGNKTRGLFRGQLVHNPETNISY